MDQNTVEEDFSEDIISALEEENSVDLNDVEETEVDVTASTEPSSEAKTTKVRKPATATKANGSNVVKLFQLPMTRVRNIMKLDTDLQTVSNEAVFLVTRATELFIESLTREAFTHTLQSKKKTMQKQDVENVISSIDNLLFLDGALEF